VKCLQFNKLLTVIVLILLASCAPKYVKPGPEGVPAGEIAQRAALLQNSVKSVKGLASVRIRTPQDKISYTQVTLAEEPDLLRLEALNPFGKTVGFISSDGENIYIISPADRGVYGIEDAFDLSYVYPGLELEITIQNLVDLVMGRVPKDVFRNGQTPEAANGPEGVTLTFKNGEGAGDDTLWLNPLNSRVEKARIILDTGRPATVTYEYFDGLINGHFFPRVIDFKTDELAITITYQQDVELNSPVDRTLLKPMASAPGAGSEKPI